MWVCSLLTSVVDGGKSLTSGIGTCCYPLNRRLFGSRASLDVLEREQSVASAGICSPDLPAHGFVTVPVTLSSFLLAIVSLQNSSESGVKGWNSGSKNVRSWKVKIPNIETAVSRCCTLFECSVCHTVCSFSLLCYVLILNIPSLSTVPCYVTCVHCGLSRLVCGSKFHLCVEVKFWQNTDTQNTDTQNTYTQNTDAQNTYTQISQPRAVLSLESNFVCT